jgi:hypothetical protein
MADEGDSPVGQASDAPAAGSGLAHDELDEPVA